MRASRYPKACNSVETILLHKSLLSDTSPAWCTALELVGEPAAAPSGAELTAAQAVVAHLQSNGVTLRPGPELSRLIAADETLLGPSATASSLVPAESMHVEYVPRLRVREF